MFLDPENFASLLWLRKSKFYPDQENLHMDINVHLQPVLFRIYVTKQACLASPIPAQEILRLHFVAKKCFSKNGEQR
jgi:hypothetical protein